MRQAQLTATWREALLGGAPFALLAAMLGLQHWSVPWCAAAAAVVAGGVTLYGLWLGRPAWFYPWAGAALTMPIVAGYIAFAVLQRAVPELGHGAGPLALAGVAGAALYFPVGLAVVAGCVAVALRRDWLDASVLLSPLPGVLVWVVQVHRTGAFAPDAGSPAGTAAMLGALYLCMAIATVAYLRISTRSTRFTLLVGTAIVLLSAATLLTTPEAASRRSPAGRCCYWRSCSARRSPRGTREPRVVTRRSGAEAPALSHP